MIKTVGDLKNFIKDLPDDMLIAMYKRDMETSGYRNEICSDVRNMSQQTKETYDRFDCTTYIYTVFVDDKNGKEVMVIF